MLLCVHVPIRLPRCSMKTARHNVTATPCRRRRTNLVLASVARPGQAPRPRPVRKLLSVQAHFKWCSFNRNVLILSRNCSVIDYVWFYCSGKKSKTFDWSSYLLKEGVMAAPYNCFKEVLILWYPSLAVPFVLTTLKLPYAVTRKHRVRVCVLLQYQSIPETRNGFKTGMRLEAIDPNHPSHYCVVSVVETRGYRYVHVHVHVCQTAAVWGSAGFCTNQAFLDDSMAYSHNLWHDRL